MEASTRAPSRDTEPATPRAWPLLALAAVCFSGLALAYVLLVQTGFGQRLDQVAFESGTGATRAHEAAGQVLDTINVGSLALAVLALGGLAIARRRPAYALVPAAVVGGSLLITEVLKHVILTRPDLLEDGEVLVGNSFPSGHTTVAFSLGLAALLVAPPSWRRPVGALAFLYGTGIAIATVAASWHRPSDAAGAMLVVFGWTALVALFAHTRDSRDLLSAHRRSGEWDGPSVARGYLLAAAGLLALGWLAAIAVVAARQLDRLQFTGLGGSFLLSSAALAALAAVLMAALITAMRLARGEAAGGGSYAVAGSRSRSGAGERGGTGGAMRR